MLMNSLVELDLTRVEPAIWIEASVAAQGTDYGPVGEVIREALERSEQA